MSKTTSRLLRSAEWLTGPTDSKRRWIVTAIVVGVVATMWTLHACFYPLAFPVDDAYITLHNAQVLLTGSDANYAGTSAFVGSTSLLHLLLVAAYALVMPIEWAGYSVMWTGALMYALGAMRLAFAQRVPAGVALLVVTLAVTVGEVPHQLMNGLETGWAMAALLWTLSFACEGPPRARAAAACCGMLPLWRPELALAAACIFLCVALQRWESLPEKRAAARTIAGDLLFGFLIVLPAVLVLTYATGEPLPTTVMAKQHWFAEGCLVPAVKWGWVSTSFLAFLRVLGPVSAAMVCLVLSPIGRAGAIFIFGMLLAYFRNFPGALGHYEYRYQYVILPFLIFGLVSCLRHERRLLRNVGLALAGMSLVVGLLGAPAAWQRHLEFIRFTTGELQQVATWARNTLPKSARLLVHDAGYIAFGTDLNMVDLVGLKTPRSAEIHDGITWPSCGRWRAEAINRIALQDHVDHLVVLNGWDRIYGIARSLRAHGWRLEPLRSADGPGYDVYRLAPPAARR